MSPTLTVGSRIVRKLSSNSFFQSRNFTTLSSGQGKSSLLGPIVLARTTASRSKFEQQSASSVNRLGSFGHRKGGWDGHNVNGPFPFVNVKSSKGSEFLLFLRHHSNARAHNRGWDARHGAKGHDRTENASKKKHQGSNLHNMIAFQQDLAQKLPSSGGGIITRYYLIRKSNPATRICTKAQKHTILKQCNTRTKLIHRSNDSIS